MKSVSVVIIPEAWYSSAPARYVVSNGSWRSSLAQVKGLMQDPHAHRTVLHDGISVQEVSEGLLALSGVTVPLARHYPVSPHRHNIQYKRDKVAAQTSLHLPGDKTSVRDDPRRGILLVCSHRRVSGLYPPKVASPVSGKDSLPHFRPDFTLTGFGTRGRRNRPSFS